jgi:hypothetical protein
MEGGLVIAGVLVDVDGKPYAGAWVNAQVDGDAKGGHGGHSQVQGDGTFRLEGLKAATYRIHVQRHDNGPAPEPVRATAPATGLRIQLPRSERIAGRIQGAGDLSGFQVMAAPDGTLNSRRSALTASDGSFTIEGIGSGGQTLMVRKDNDDRFGFLPGVQPGTPNATVELQAGRTIEGVVESASGSSVQNWYVMASSPTWRSWTRAGADGTFALRGLPEGRYKLTVHGDNATASEDDVATGTTGVRLRLTPR